LKNDPNLDSKNDLLLIQQEANIKALENLEIQQKFIEE
jgi:hypothetical protein